MSEGRAFTAARAGPQKRNPPEERPEQPPKPRHQSRLGAADVDRSRIDKAEPL